MRAKLLANLIFFMRTNFREPVDKVELCATILNRPRKLYQRGADISHVWGKRGSNLIGSKVFSEKKIAAHRKDYYVVLLQKTIKKLQTSNSNSLILHTVPPHKSKASRGPARAMLATKAVSPRYRNS